MDETTFNSIFIIVVVFLIIEVISAFQSGYNTASIQYKNGVAYLFNPSTWFIIFYKSNTTCISSGSLSIDRNSYKLNHADLLNATLAYNKYYDKNLIICK